MEDSDEHLVTVTVGILGILDICTLMSVIRNIELKIQVIRMMMAIWPRSVKAMQQ